MSSKLNIATTAVETSVSHETSYPYHEQLEDAKRFEGQARLDALNGILEGFKRQQQRLEAVAPFAKQAVLLSLYGKLIRVTNGLIRGDEKVTFKQLEDHRVAEGYFGVLSLYDKLQILQGRNMGAMVFFSVATKSGAHQGVPNYGLVTPAKNGWQVRIQNGDPGEMHVLSIFVSGEELHDILAHAKAGTIQDVPWDGVGVMNNSTNYNGKTLVVSGFTLHSILDTQEYTWKPSQPVRLSLSWGDYQTLVQAPAFGRSGIDTPDTRWLAQISEKFCGDAAFVPNSRGENFYLSCMIILANNDRKGINKRPREWYFRKGGMLYGYPEEALTSVQDFLPYYAVIADLRKALEAESEGEVEGETQQTSTQAAPITQARVEATLEGQVEEQWEEMEPPL